LFTTIAVVDTGAPSQSNAQRTAWFARGLSVGGSMPLAAVNSLSCAMPPQTPYSADLGDRDPIRAMRDSLALFRSLAAWSDADFERSYAAGKWTARQILVHLAQCELAFGSRARLALTTPNYTSQAFDQDLWMNREATLGARAALDALVGVGAMNAAFFAALSPSDRATTFTHPEYGPISIDWLIHQMAGHQLHHLRQLDALASR
jgi:uncharacterized damage-inducible protein DinB